MSQRNTIIASKLVQVVGQFRHLHLQILALAVVQHNVLQFTLNHGISWHVVPVVKDALWECLSTCLLTQGRDKAERLSNRKICLHLPERCAFTLILFEDAATAQVHTRVNSTHCLLRACDFHQEDWLLKSWLTCHQCCERAATHWWSNLASATVNRISVQGDIHEAHLHTAHVLLAQWTLLGNPLPGTVDVLLDLQEVCHTLSSVHHNVCTFCFRTPSPDLGCLSGIPFVLLLQKLCALLGLCLRLVAADGARVGANVPRPEGDGAPLLHDEAGARRLS